MAGRRLAAGHAGSALSGGSIPVKGRAPCCGDPQSRHANGIASAPISREPGAHDYHRETRDLHQRIRVLRARHHEHGGDRLGTNLHLSCRHHGEHLPSASRAVGPRPERTRHQRTGGAHRRAGAQVSGQLSLPRHCRIGHRLVGSARQDGGQAGGLAPRRSTAAAARLRLLDEARHLAGCRGRADAALAR